MRFSIEQKLLENIVNYLVTKPYNEVQALIASVQQDIKPVKEEKDSMEWLAVGRSDTKGDWKYRRANKKLY